MLKKKRKMGRCTWKGEGNIILAKKEGRFLLLKYTTLVKKIYSFVKLTEYSAYSIISRQKFEKNKNPNINF